MKTREWVIADTHFGHKNIIKYDNLSENRFCVSVDMTNYEPLPLKDIIRKY